MIPTISMALKTYREEIEEPGETGGRGGKQERMEEEKGGRGSRMRKTGLERGGRKQCLSEVMSQNLSFPNMLPIVPDL